MNPRTALVTGSAGGIGRAIATALAQAGHRVVGIDRTAEATAAIEQHGVDLSDPRALEQFTEALGPIDILVNNASVLVDKPLSDTTLDDFDLLFDVNLRAPVLLTRAVLPGMVESGWGRVINLSSVGARTGGVSNTAVYNMTKAGIASFTRFLARHYGSHGITSNAIAPGGIETNMTAHLTGAQRDAIAQQIPAGRMAPPVEVAGAAVFLASDEAAFVNGVTLDVNGGWVMAP
jgi:NAD(P)-dependent dehydrogenase (short-subunit alcohol dehydrogenase family)